MSSAGRNKKCGFKEAKLPTISKKEAKIVGKNYRRHLREHDLPVSRTCKTEFGDERKPRPRTKPFKRKHHTWWPLFMSALKETGSIKKACIEADVSEKTVYAVIHRQNPSFIRQMTLAEGEFLLMEFLRLATKDPPAKGERQLRKEIGQESASALITYLLQFEEIAKKLRENTLWSI